MNEKVNMLGQPCSGVEHVLSILIPVAFVALIVFIWLRVTRRFRKDDSSSLLDFLQRHKGYLITILGLSLLFWPQLDFCWQLLHNWIGGWTHREIVKGTMADSYSVFSSIVASFSLVVGLFSYWVATKNHQDEDFRLLQMREFDHVFGAFEKYCDAIGTCVLNEGGKMFEGDQVVNRLYEKYRLRELRLLVRICCAKDCENGEDMAKCRAELKKLDTDFMTDFASAKLQCAAKVLFKELNWVWSLERSMKDLYRDRANRVAEIGKVRDRLVALLSYELGPQGQFVFGKYRHHSYEIEKSMVAARKIDKEHGEMADLSKCFVNDRPATYRGVYFADMLFQYERTLLAYSYSEKEKADLFVRVSSALQSRDELEGLGREAALPRNKTGCRLYDREFLPRLCGC